MNKGRLYKKDSKGKIRYWEIQTVINEKDQFLQLTYTGVYGDCEKTGKVATKEIKDNKQGTAAERAPGLIETQYKNKLKSGGLNFFAALNVLK